MASGGLALVVVAMASSVLLVTDVIVERWVAILLGGTVGAWLTLLWAVLPVLRRVSAPDGDDLASRTLPRGNTER
jgi:hypothetical protein